MNKLKTTKEAAATINERSATLLQAIYTGRLAAPQKIGRAYLWAAADIDRACRLFKRRPLDEYISRQKLNEVTKN